MSFLGSSKGIRAQARQPIANGPMPPDYQLDHQQVVGILYKEEEHIDELADLRCAGVPPVGTPQRHRYCLAETTNDSRAGEAQ
jgi:hypothetical protein